MMGDRHRDGMCFIPPKAGTLDWALLRNWGTLLLVLTAFVPIVIGTLVVERESYKSRRDKANTKTTDKGQISS